MKTTVYKSFDELNGKTLRRGDVVCFKAKGINLRYTVEHNYLWNPTGNNFEIFSELGIIDFRKLAGRVYGYRSKGGVWPQTESYDYEALTRLVLVLFAFLEDEETVEVRVGNKWVKVDKGATVVTLNDTYYAIINHNDKIVRVGCQTFSFDKLRELVSYLK